MLRRRDRRLGCCRAAPQECRSRRRTSTWRRKPPNPQALARSRNAATFSPSLTG